MSPSRSTPTTSPIRGPSSRRTPRVSRRSSHPISITDLRYVLNSENDEKDTLHIVLSAGGRLHVVRQEPLRRCAARTPCDGRVSRGVRRLSARRRRGETLRPQYGQCLYRPDRCAGHAGFRVAAGITVSRCSTCPTIRRYSTVRSSRSTLSARTRKSTWR